MNDRAELTTGHGLQYPAVSEISVNSVGSGRNTRSAHIVWTPVDTMDLEAGTRQSAGEVAADETTGTGDEHGSCGIREAQAVTSKRPWGTTNEPYSSL